jgi:hypothetical protein
MSRFSKDIAQYWCGAIIAAPLIAFLLGVRVEGIENRRLPEIPDRDRGAGPGSRITSID